MSDRPVAALLQLKPGESLLAVNAPESYREAVRPLPNGARFVDSYDDEPDVVHVFVHSETSIDKEIADALAKTPSGSILWVSYPKSGSDRGNGGMTRQTVHDSMQRHGAKPVSQFSFDDTWSAIRGRLA